MASLGDIRASLSADTKGFQQSVASAGAKLSDFGVKTNQVATDLNILSQGLSGIGSALGGLGQAIQTSVSGLRKMDGAIGATADGVSALGGGIRSAGQVIKGLGGLAGKAANTLRSMGNALNKIPQAFAKLSQGLGNVADKLARVAGLSGDVSGSVSQAGQTAASTVGNVAQTATALTLAGKAYDTVTQSSSATEAAVSGANQIIVRAQNTFNSFAGTAKKAPGALKKVGGTAGRAASAFAGMGRKAKVATVALGGLATAGAAIAAGGLAAATVQAAELERTIAGAAARAGATEQAYNKFSKAAREASLSSAFGANEAGKALRFLAKSGFEVEQATAALPGILEGATAAGMGAAEMGEIASNALRAFGREASATGEVMDVLVAASNSANTSVSELGKAISIVGGQANASGMDIQSVVSIVSSLQDAGIQASRAGTAVRGAISQLLDPSDEARKTLKGLGIQTKNASGEFRGLIPILSEMQAAGVNSTQMLKIFSREVGPTLQVALNQGTGALKQFREEMNNSGGESERVASFIEGTLSEQISILGGSLETLGANIGSLVIPVIKGLVVALRATVNLLNAVINAAKTAASFLAGGFLTSAKQAGVATKNTKDEVKGANKALKSHKTAAQEAARGALQFKSGAKQLRKEVDKLKKAVDDQTLSILDRAAAQGELNQKQKELQKELAKQKGKAKPVLLDQIKASMSQIDKDEKRLKNVRNSLSALREEIGFEEGASLIQIRGQGASQRQLDFIAKLRNRQKELREGLSKERDILDKRQKAYGKAVDAQFEQNLLGKERKQQIGDQFDRMQKQTSELDKQNQKLREQKSIMPDIAPGGGGRKQGNLTDVQRQAKLQQAQGRMVGMSTGGRLGKPNQSSLATLSDAERNRMMAGMGGKSGVGTQAQQDALDQGAGFLSEVGEETKKQKDKTVSAIDATKKLTGSVSSLATTALKAAGASKQAVQGISGVSSAIQSFAGAAMAGGPVGVISGILGGVTSLIGGLTGGGSDTKASNSRRDQRRFADILAKRMGEEMERRNLRPVEVSVAGRAQGTQAGPSGESPREFNRRVEEAESLQGVGLGG